MAHSIGRDNGPGTVPILVNIHMDKDIFSNHEDYWMVADNIKKLYMSEGSLLSLMDFERVLDELDIYAFRNWKLGELVSGPKVGRYKVTCIFMWPENLMPDPRGGRRLLPFDCEVQYQRRMIRIPIRIENPDDYVPGTHKARLISKPVWLVSITMPKSLMSDIRTGSIEIEDESIELDELDRSYEQDLDKQEFRDGVEQAQQSAQQSSAPAMTAPGGPAPPGLI